MLDLGATTDLCRVLSDPTRVRLLALLEVEDLTVAELTRITRLPQPRVSTHLGKLRDAGLVRDRRDGTSAFYRIDRRGMDGEAARLLETLRGSTRDPLLEQDRRRLAEAIAARPGGSTWAEAVAGSMQRHYSPGRTWESLARGVVGLSELGDVIDVASGDGVLAELLAPHARSICCLDRSSRVLRAARRRLETTPRVRLLRGDMHRLPFSSASFDHALLLSALCYAREPRSVLEEVARVLRPGGRLIAVTLRRHEHREAVARYGHVSHGHEPDELCRLLDAAGFEVILCDVTSRESRPPHFEILTAHAERRDTR